jgi:hypothetical protein
MQTIGLEMTEILPALRNARALLSRNTILFLSLVLISGRG